MNRFFFILLTFFLFPSTVEASYVLPYPSAMPGSSLYTVYTFIDSARQYWSFGNFAQFSYHLQQSDKYLVEAKTLFEYNQYLLGYKSLEKSTYHFQKVTYFLREAHTEGKNTTEKEIIMHEASIKHKEVLEKMMTQVPSTFDWIPEKGESQHLRLHEALKNAITVRGTE